MLAATRCAPKSFAEMDAVDPKALAVMQRLGSQSIADIPHMILCGPPGSGKRTLALNLVAGLFGPDAHKTVTGPLPGVGVFQSREAMRTKMQCERSNYHIEMNASVVKHDREHVSTMVEALATIRPIRERTVVIMTDFGDLHKDLQNVFRRPFESLESILFILIATTTASVTDPIRSRCPIIRVHPPTLSRAKNAVCSIAKSQGWDISKKAVETMLRDSRCNLRETIAAAECLSLGAAASPGEAVAQMPCTMGAVVAKEVANAECSPNAVLALRKRVYEMLEMGVPMPAFFRDLTVALLARAQRTQNDPETCANIVATMAEHEAAACAGQNVVHHLEAAYAASLSCLARGPAAAEKVSTQDAKGKQKKARCSGGGAGKGCKI